jgi:hypothetical protein
VAVPSRLRQLVRKRDYGANRPEQMMERSASEA